MNLPKMDQPEEVYAYTTEDINGENQEGLWGNGEAQACLTYARENKRKAIRLVYTYADSELMRDFCDHTGPV